jgi:hypothetical protein
MGRDNIFPKMKEDTRSSGNIMKWKKIRFSGTKKNQAAIKPSMAGQSHNHSQGKITHCGDSGDNCITTTV